MASSNQTRLRNSLRIWQCQTLTILFNSTRTCQPSARGTKLYTWDYKSLMMKLRNRFMKLWGKLTSTMTARFLWTSTSLITKKIARRPLWEKAKSTTTVKILWTNASLITKIIVRWSKKLKYRESILMSKSRMTLFKSVSVKIQNGWKICAYGFSSTSTLTKVVRLILKKWKIFCRSDTWKNSIRWNTCSVTSKGRSWKIF